MANDTQSMCTLKGSGSDKNPNYYAKSDEAEREGASHCRGSPAETPRKKQNRSCSPGTPISKRFDKDSPRGAPAKMNFDGIKERRMWSPATMPERCKNQWRPRHQRSRSMGREGREHAVGYSGRRSRQDWGGPSVAPVKKKWLDARSFRALLQFKSKKTGQSANTKDKFKVGDMGIMECVAGKVTVSQEPMVSISSKRRALNPDIALGSSSTHGVLKRKLNDSDLHSHSPAMSVKEICSKEASFEHHISSSRTKSRRLSNCAACFKQQRVDGYSQHQEVCTCNTESHNSRGGICLSKEAHEEMAVSRTPQDNSAGGGYFEEDSCKGKQNRDDGERSAEAQKPNGPSKTEISASLKEKLEVGRSTRLFEGWHKDKEVSLDIPGDLDGIVCVICKLGGKLLRCHGKDCRRNYHLSCLVPPLTDVQPGVWLCENCVKKKIESGVHSVSGVECIFGGREVEVSTSKGMMRVKQYLVKYKGLAHVHNCWIPEYQLVCEAPVLVAKFKQRHLKEKAIVKWNSDWTAPQRLLKKRLLMYSQHDGSDQRLYEWFVKWKGLGYEHSTWELENEPFLSSNEAMILRRDYERRCEKSKRASDPTRIAKVIEQRKGSFCELPTLPRGCPSGLDGDHLRFVNKLRDHWQKCQNAVIIDEKSYAWRPFLIISSSAALCVWEAELMRLAPSINVVVYDGNKDVRKCIWETEFYEDGGCVMVEVLLLTPDVVVEDFEVLEVLGWEAIIIDECQLYGILEYFEHIKMLNSDFKLLVFSCPPKDSIPEYISLLSFLGSQIDGINHDNTTTGPIDDISLVAQLKEMFAQYIAYERKLDSSKFIEYWVPVQLSDVQLKQYCATLISNFYSLSSQSKTDPVGAVRDILISVQKCCDHPYLNDLSLQMNLTKGHPEFEYLDIGINASGKLQLLDNVLLEIKKRGLRTLILFQSIGRCRQNSIGDILDDYLHQRFGPDSYERVDGGVTNSKKHAALNMFNEKERGRFVFLIETRACLSTIKLSAVDTVIIFNSDLNPLNDLRCLQRIRIESQFEQLKVFRFYSSCTVEEKGLILAKQGMTIEGSKDYVNSSVSHMLLVWGASFLFNRLDELDCCNSSSLDLKTSDRSLLNNVVLELFTELPNPVKTRGRCDCSIILEVKRSGGAYPKNISLLGEKEAHSAGEEPPHIFWRKLLEGRDPSWRYLPQPSQRARKKVPFCDELLDDAEVIKGNVKKKHEKAINNIINSVPLRTWLKRKRKTVPWSRKAKMNYISRLGVSPDGSSHSSLKKASISSASSATQDGDEGLKYFTLPLSNVNDLNHGSPMLPVSQEVPQKVGFEGRTKLHDGPECLPQCEKLEIMNLCQALKLSEDVKYVAGKLLEYTLNQHNVKAERDTIFQAFQIALCWTAASLLQYEVNHRESLELAKEQLNFECEERDAECIYSNLQKMKKRFLSQTAVSWSANEFTSPKGKSNTSGNLHTLSQLLDGKTTKFTASDEQTDEGGKQEGSQMASQEGQSYSPRNETILNEVVLDRTLEHSASNQEDLEEGEIRESSQNDNWFEGVSMEQELIPDSTKANAKHDVNVHLSSPPDEIRSGRKDNACDATGDETILCGPSEPETTNLFLSVPDQLTLPSGVIAESLAKISNDREVARIYKDSEGMPTGTLACTLQSVGRNALACESDVMKSETVDRVTDAVTGQQSWADYSDSMIPMSSKQVEQSKVNVSDLQQASASLEMGGEGEPSRFNSFQQTAFATEAADTLPLQTEQSNNSLIHHNEPLAPNALGNGQTSRFEGQNSSQQMEVSTIKLADATSSQVEQSKDDISVSEHVSQKQLPRRSNASIECSQPTASSVMGSAHELNTVCSLQQTDMMRQQQDEAMPSQNEHSNDPSIQHSDPLLHNALRNAQAGRSEGQTFPQETEVNALHQADDMLSQVEQDANAQLPPALSSDPLLNEVGRLHRELEKVIKVHEDEKAQLNSQRDREIEEVHRKYNALIDNAQVTYLQQKKALEAWFDKVYLNMMLAEAFKSKFADVPKAGCSALREGPSSTFRQQSFGMHSPQTARRSMCLSSPPIQVHNPTDLFSGNPAASCYRMPMALTPNLQAAPCHRVPMTPTPNLQASSYQRMPMAPTPNLQASPCYGMLMTPPDLQAAPCYRMPIATTPNLQAGIEIRAPAPHLQGTRPSIVSPNHTAFSRYPSLTPPLTASPQTPQFCPVPPQP